MSPCQNLTMVAPFEPKYGFRAGFVIVIARLTEQGDRPEFTPATIFIFYVAFTDPKEVT